MASDDNTTARWKLHKKRCLWYLYGSALGWGMANALLPETSTILGLVDLGVLFSWLFVLYYWCYCDSNERGYSLGPVLKVGLVALFACAFPYYVFRTRGAAGFKTLGLSLLVAFTVFGTFMVGCLLGIVPMSLLGVDFE